jgi:beta-glucuronidase
MKQKEVPMRYVIIFLCLLVNMNMNGQTRETNLIINVDGRKMTSLNGKWSAIIDPYETGYYNYRYEPDPNGYFKNARPRDKTERVEYDFEASELLNVPGDWNMQRDELFLYEGTIWYKKSFNYRKKTGSRVFVYFGAANYHSRVYFNGQYFGEHTGGFTPFNMEITGLIREVDNFLIVKVDNKRHREGVPTLNTDWWNYGGLTRRVLLLEVPGTFIRDYFIQLKPGSPENIEGWIQLDGKTPRQTVKIQIPEAFSAFTVQTDQDGYAKFSYSVNLELWSPENPRRYDVVIQSETDTVRDRIGFRSIETRGNEILLNGKSIFLRGISIHEEAPFRSGRAFSKEDAGILLDWAKDLGCNFVRLAHYPHNEFMIREAERMGLLVWSEIPVYWTILWENPLTFNNAANQLFEMITRDKNRASVILWSIGNETPLYEARLRFMKDLAAKARELDPTRLVTAALERHYSDPNTLLIDENISMYWAVMNISAGMTACRKRRNQFPGKRYLISR